MYQLPELNLKQIEGPDPVGAPKAQKNNNIFAVVLFIVGLFAGLIFGYYFYNGAIGTNILSKLSQQNQTSTEQYVPQTTQEQRIIQVVKDASPAVVSIIISKQVPVYQYQAPSNQFDPFGLFGIPQRTQTGTQLQEVGAGTGFIVSEDGLVVTNKHVASDATAEYTAITSAGKEYAIKIVATDPVQDLAIMRIQSTDKFPTLKLGNAASIQVGQSAIAIGYALGEFQNSVSVGVISGLGRTITATDPIGGSETLQDVIQVDAAINPGNSGGPLLNLNGEVIGVNTATADTTVGQNIGFAISIDKATRDIEQTKSTGKISYPFLGIRYVAIDAKLAKAKSLSVDYGVLISKGVYGEAAISANSPAQKAGLKENDIVLEAGGQKITADNTLSKIIDDYVPGQNMELKILRGTQEMTINVTLGEWQQ